MASQMDLFNDNVADNHTNSKASSASVSKAKDSIKQSYLGLAKMATSSSASSTMNQSVKSSSNSNKEVIGNYTILPSSSVSASSTSNRKDVTSPIDKARNEVADWHSINGKKRLPAYVLSKVLLNNLHFVKIRSNRGSDRLFMYMGNKNNENYGLYTNNRDQLEQLFRLVDPQFSTNTFDNVELGIKAHTKAINADDIRRRNKHLIPVENGLVDMSSKPRKLVPFDPKYFFTLKVITPYPLTKPQLPVIRTADGSIWTPKRFMKQISNGNPGTKKELWQVLLDSFDATKSRGKAIILLGKSSTGKSTFERLIANVVGPAHVASKNINQLSGRFASADLLEAIVDLGDNLEPDVKIPRSSTFHSIVTGDYVSVEPKGQKSFSRKFHCTIVNSSNGLPDFEDKQGIRRRLLIIYFAHKFYGDGNVVKRDYLSRPDVRQWFLYQALQQPDFNDYYISPKSKDLLRAYIIGNNPLKQFEIEYFNKWNLNKVPTKFLYHYYLAFADDNNYPIISSASFSRQFRRIIQPKYVKKTSKLTDDDLTKLANISQKSDLTLAQSPLLRQHKSYKCFVKVK